MIRLEDLKYKEKVRSDFDKIAMLRDEHFDNNNPFHHVLIDMIPDRSKLALDIGCGKGEFTRLLSSRADHVTGIDFSKNMIAAAIDLSKEFSNIEYIEADILNFPLLDDHYDLIVSIATFHHLDIDRILPHIIPSLKKEGMLVILDLFRPESIMDYAKFIVSFFYKTALKLKRSRKKIHDKNIKNFWNDHASTDVFSSIKEIKEQFGRYMKDFNVTTHLLWRYSLVWKK